MEPSSGHNSTDELQNLLKKVAQLEKAVTGSSPPEQRSLAERIASLENEVTQLRGSNQNKDKTEATNNSLPKSTIPEVRRVAWSDFKNWYNEDDARYAIEALYVGADLSDEVRREHQRRRRSTASQTPEGSSKQITDQEMSRRWIYRIRIQSRAVLAILSQHIRQNWDDEIRTFIHPFKPLISLHDKMKDSLAELERKWADQEKIDADLAKQTARTSEADKNEATTDTPNTSEPANTLVSPNIDSCQKLQAPEDSIIALREMRCYIKFMEDEVMHIRSRLVSCTAENPPKVRWDDLWCLFERGQYVFTPVDPSKRTGNIRQPDQPQTPGWQTVRKVLATVSPRPRLKTPGRQRRKNKKSDPNKDDDEDDDEDDNDSNDWFICESDPEPQRGSYSLDLWCYHIDYDGRAFRPVFDLISIDYYHGEKEVDSLVAYPLKFARDEQQILEHLRSRGESFKKYIHTSRSFYSGRSLDDKDARHYEGEVIIDFEEALVHMPNWMPNWLMYTTYRPEFPSTLDDFPIKKWTRTNENISALEVSEILQMDDGVESASFNDSLREDSFLVAWKEWDKPGLETKPPAIEIVDPVLLPQRLLAYFLRERKFCKIDVNFLQPVKKQMAFDDLKIDPRNKRLVRSLVHSHFQSRKMEKVGVSKQITQDIIQGKANNLIILLHGVPGVGKTATAEAVAEVNDKPLFPITCGDLGLEPEDIENRLTEIFQLANRWNCVLLLDEADVFLAARRTEDLKRNALVSVFLRILEYYNGILILTTNRVGTIDEAFQSRIHTMLYYPRLTFEQTKEIFTMNIRKLEAIESQRSQETGQPPMKINEHDILIFAQDHFERDEDGRWNGRQIRNAFQIASSMARYEWFRENDDTVNIEVPPILNSKYFERVASTTNEFNDYLKAARGKDNPELAHERSERADHFEAPRMYSDNWSPRPKFYKRPHQTHYSSYGSHDGGRSRFSTDMRPRYDDDQGEPPYSHGRNSSYSARESSSTPPQRERIRDSASPGFSDQNSVRIRRNPSPEAEDRLCRR
ncbi:hypothetical protein F4776DRAFT_646336 [Hypoxylon sp. NC0597]|nr:hypothetical protein F4776DRAFT_646336 [Hypoxylon sp. NC0597]